LVPQLPPFLVGPPESVTVSIIVENNDDFRQYCPTSVSASSPSSNFRVKNEDDQCERRRRRRWRRRRRRKRN
jgi:hypothetical protein